MTGFINKNISVFPDMRNQFPDRDDKTVEIDGKLRLNGLSCMQGTWAEPD